ncbi:MAG: VOC family protein [Bdellovibrionales bacterium]|nr:VOC family protein [Bdellovibrionales bacterium]
MAEVKYYKQGAFNWVDLMTTDAQKAMAFYEELFGWQYEEIEGEQGSYYMAYSNGSCVSALFERSADSDSPQASLWNTYISVSNVEQILRQAHQLGADILRPTTQALDFGQFATIKDPQGAVINFWQAQRHIGTEIKKEPNALYWVELMSNQLKESKQFYSQLFPQWKCISHSNSPSETSAEDVSIIFNGEEPEGSMQQMDSTFRHKVPSHWSVFFEVADLTESLTKAKNMGAKIIWGPKQFEKGNMATIIDGVGAPLTLVEVKPQNINSTLDKKENS